MSANRDREDAADLRETTRRLGEAPIGKLLIRLSGPAMLSMLTISLYNFFDAFWVAKLGHEAIAAVTVTIPFQVIIIAISVGSGIGINALVSRRFGEKNVEATNRTAGQIFPIAAFFGIVLMLVAVFLPRPILTLYGATPDVLDMATQYLTTIAYGIPFIIVSILANDLLRGSGEAIKPMIFMTTASVANIILDPLFIFGYGIFPEMGVQGAALATVISHLLGAIISLSYLVAHKSAYRLKWHYFVPRLPIMRDIYRIGLPSIAIELSWSLFFAVFFNALSSYGSLAVAVGGLVIRIIDLAYMPIFGVVGAVLPIVGYCYGAGLWHRLWKAFILASIGLMVLMGIVTVIMEVMTPTVIGVFSKESELMAVAVPAMRICLAALALVGPQLLVVATFQGLSKGRDALLVAVIRQLVFLIPLILLLPRIWGITGIWLSIPISDVTAFIIARLWLFREYRLSQQSA